MKAGAGLSGQLCTFFQNFLIYQKEEKRNHTCTALCLALPEACLHCEWQQQLNYGETDCGRNVALKCVVECNGISKPVTPEIMDYSEHLVSKQLMLQVVLNRVFLL